ncbi:MAG: hypothetical protein JWP34_4871 [Massilia sp.]|nr:hypothetical protein [Massilia sp.]
MHREVIKLLTSDRLDADQSDRLFRRMLSMVMIQRNYTTALKMPDGSITTPGDGMPSMTVVMETVYARDAERSELAAIVDHLTKKVNAPPPGEGGQGVIDLQSVKVVDWRFGFLRIRL